MFPLSLPMLALTLALNSPSPAPATPVITPPSSHHTFLADDIVRRLHRMGFDGIKTYNTRPPEREGELC